MKNKIKKYWDKRSKNGLLAGSNTVLADLLEINYISSQIKKKRTILDAGCGNGIFLKRISKKTKYKFVKIKKIHEFSSFFYFLSRIVNAYLTKIEKKNFLIKI